MVQSGILGTISRVEVAWNDCGPRWKRGTAGSGADVIKEEITVQPEPGESHIRNWLECVRSRKQPNAPIELGYNHSVACTVGYGALITGRKMKYLPLLRGIVKD